MQTIRKTDENHMLAEIAGQDVETGEALPRFAASPVITMVFIS